MLQQLKQIKTAISFNFISLEIHLIIPRHNWEFCKELSKSLATWRVSPCELTWKSYFRALYNFLSCVQVGAISRTKFVSSKDNGSLGRRNGWSLVLTWFVSDTAIRKTAIKLSFEVSYSSTALEKMLCHTSCIPMFFFIYICI